MSDIQRALENAAPEDQEAILDEMLEQLDPEERELVEGDLRESIVSGLVLSF